mmetsp:Transcript_15221/g.54817  ORF Transcript_15221/g.54817 Transcript_15221/m.54817 type:complete len:216 (+) Transcript_15221:1234-1881(+)
MLYKRNPAPKRARATRLQVIQPPQQILHLHVLRHRHDPLVVQLAHSLRRDFVLDVDALAERRDLVRDVAVADILPVRRRLVRDPSNDPILHGFVRQQRHQTLRVLLFDELRELLGLRLKLALGDELPVVNPLRDGLEAVHVREPGAAVVEVVPSLAQRGQDVVHVHLHDAIVYVYPVRRGRERVFVLHGADHEERQRLGVKGVLVRGGIPPNLAP